MHPQNPQLSMIIKSAEFITSVSQVKQLPGTTIPEFSFIGRSNVGKSSLINTLTDRKLLAKISSIPGKTKTLNYFLINNLWHLVDMPGYGYAKISKFDKAKFQKLSLEYFRLRKNLIYAFVLIDSRHKPQKTDIDFIKICGEYSVPYVIVFTKSDKVKITELNNNITAFQNEILKYYYEMPQYFIFSIVTKEGRNEILSFIEKEASKMVTGNYLVANF